MENPHIDEVDAKIIDLLKKNGRLPNTEMASRLGLSETAIRKRLKRLLDEEIIQIVAIVNQMKLGYDIEGNIKIKADIKKVDHVKNELQRLERLWYVAYLSGSSDFDVEFSVKSQEELRQLIETINRIDGVADSALSIKLQQIKNVFKWKE